jgi:hypothetical protein
MRLYGIDEADIAFVLSAPAALDALAGERGSVQETIPHLPHRYVLKVVFVRKGSDIEVVTVYPMKKGAKE